MCCSDSCQLVRLFKILSFSKVLVHILFRFKIWASYMNTMSDFGLIDSFFFSVQCVNDIYIPNTSWERVSNENIALALHFCRCFNRLTIHSPRWWTCMEYSSPQAAVSNPDLQALCTLFLFLKGRKCLFYFQWGVLKINE